MKDSEQASAIRALKEEWDLDVGKKGMLGQSLYPGGDLCAAGWSLRVNGKERFQIPGHWVWTLVCSEMLSVFVNQHDLI